MRITHEADYAIRIMYCLAERNQTISAKQISDDSGVPSRFALKILRRLTQAGLTESFKGVSSSDLIDGPIEINHCLSSEFDCSRVQQKNECTFHRLFSAINQDIRSKLYDLPLSQFVPEKNQA